jgi:Domain of unknown function (DUF4440)
VSDALQQVEDEWARIVAERDGDAAERFLAPDFELRSDGGVAPVMRREAWLAALPEIETTSLRARVVTSREYGDTVVVWALLDWDASVAGRSLTGRFAVTDVFVRRDGRWRPSWRLSTRVYER